MLDLEYNSQLGQSGGYFFLGNRLNVPFHNLVRLGCGFVFCGAENEGGTSIRKSSLIDLDKADLFPLMLKRDITTSAPVALRAIVAFFLRKPFLSLISRFLPNECESACNNDPLKGKIGVQN